MCNVAGPQSNPIRLRRADLPPESPLEEHSSGWTRHRPAVGTAMMAAAWPLSAVAGLLPASLSLTLLLATLVPPSPLPPKPCSSVPASSSPRRARHLSLFCAGVHPGAGRSGRLLRAHPQDRMHALVSQLPCSRLILFVSPAICLPC